MPSHDLMSDFRLKFGSLPSSKPLAKKVEIPPAKMQSVERLCFVVDDEPEVQKMLAAAIKDVGFQARSFEDAKGVVEGLRQQHPKLIFLDVSLAGSDAVEVLGELKKAEYVGQIVVMSGHHQKLLEDLKAVGVSHGLKMLPPLRKPFDISVVRKIASECILSNPRPIPKLSIDEALANNWMKAWYQPKIDLSQKMLVGCEALARIEHPEFGVVPPGKFIPGASPESLKRLAEFVLRAVLKDATSFFESGLTLRPSLNMPVEALLTLPIAQIVRDCRPKGNAWKGVIIEVTEDQLVNDLARAQEVATQLKIYDVALSIDDFGVGYSSLARLKHFPFAELKLDMSFVKDCNTDAQNRALCKTIVELAHAFGAIAVAEGIEKPEELRTLFEMGCDIGQGYLLAKPMPLEYFLDMINKRKATPATVFEKLNKIA